MLKQFACIDPSIFSTILDKDQLAKICRLVQGLQKKVEVASRFEKGN